MPEFQRGTVKNITFEIEYPDGSKKTSSVKDPESIKAIHFNDSLLDDTEVEIFNKSSDDWKLNPSMVVSYVNQPSIPHCTHNGCKV